MRQMTYYFNEDSVYITLSDVKSSLGKEDFQEGVYLYKSEENEVSGIEIFEFSNFTDNRIQISEKEFLDFAKSFKELRMAISLGDIMFSEHEEIQQEFEETCKTWGLQIQVLNKKKMNGFDDTPSFSIPINDNSQMEVAELCY